MANRAPELRVESWIDGAGQDRGPLTLDELGDGLKIIYCFQHWCAGCHSMGFPTLQSLVAALQPQGVGFAVVQTVFEGFEENGFDRLRETQQRYELALPFGHDSVAGQQPTIMQDYRTGGTPWYLLIDANSEVIFSDFHINGEKLIEHLQQ